MQENTGHKRNTGKYRTATKIQEFTGFTGQLGSLKMLTSILNETLNFCKTLTMSVSGGFLARMLSMPSVNDHESSKCRQQ